MARAIASFGVFDRLLGWAVGSHESMAAAVGRALLRAGLVQCGPVTYLAERDQLARRAGLRSAELPLNPPALWTALGRRWNLSPEQLAAAQDIERAVAARCAQADPGAAARLRAARRSGYRVAFCLPEQCPVEPLAELLDRHGLREAGEPIYRADRPLAEDPRGAFGPLLAAEEARAIDVTHHGGMPSDDVLGALAAGIRVVASPELGFNRYERLLDAGAPDGGGLGGALAAAARWARLEQSAADPAEAARRDVAAGVIAPCLIGLTLWALSTARRRGLRRLLVTWPDGPVLLPLARRLAERLAWPVSIGELDLRRLPHHGGGLESWLDCLRRHGLAGEPPGGLLELTPSQRIQASVHEICRTAGRTAPTCLSFSAHAVLGELYDGTVRYLDDGGVHLRPPAPAGVESMLAECTTPTPLPGSPGGVVLRVAELLLLDGELVDPSADLRPALTDLLQTLRSHPTRAERAAWPTLFAGPPSQRVGLVGVAG